MDQRANPGRVAEHGRGHVHDQRHRALIQDPQQLSAHRRATPTGLRHARPFGKKKNFTERQWHLFPRPNPRAAVRHPVGMSRYCCPFGGGGGQLERGRRAFRIPPQLRSSPSKTWVSPTERAAPALSWSISRDQPIACRSGVQMVAAHQPPGQRFNSCRGLEQHDQTNSSNQFPVQPPPVLPVPPRTSGGFRRHTAAPPFSPGADRLRRQSGVCPGDDVRPQRGSTQTIPGPT